MCFYIVPTCYNACLWVENNYFEIRSFFLTTILLDFWEMTQKPKGGGGGGTTGPNWVWYKWEPLKKKIQNFSSNMFHELSFEKRKGFLTIHNNFRLFFKFFEKWLRNQRGVGPQRQRGPLEKTNNISILWSGESENRWYRSSWSFFKEKIHRHENWIFIS